MDEQVFKERTKKLALRVIQLVDGLPKDRAADVISRETNEITAVTVASIKTLRKNMNKISSD